MRDIACTQRLFALFISLDRAEGIAGDLAEERRARGATWFWLHVFLTTVTLWRSALSRAPLAILGLAVTGCAFFAAPAFTGVAAVGLFPQYIDSPVSWIALSFFWLGGALCTGVVLVCIAPARGMVACVMLAATGEALLVAFGLNAMWHEALSIRSMAFYATAMLATVLLVAGGASARRRMIAGVGPTLELKQ